MIHPLPTFPPLMAPGHWWCAYLAARLAEKDRDEAIEYANGSGNFKSRDWMRIKLKDMTVLSLPVAGGASALKNHAPATWTTAAEALRESGKIIATIATLYGRMPFAVSMLDMLAGSFGLLAAEEPVEASAICSDCFNRMERFLGLDGGHLLLTIREEIRKKNEVIRREREYRKERNDLSLSLADTLMREGPDAIFTLLPPF